MLLESNKIYSTYKKNNFLMCSSLQITSGVTVYTSDKSTKPSSISEMTEVVGLEYNKINSFLSIPRWIAVVYATSADTAYEMGIIKNPFSAN